MRIEGKRKLNGIAISLSNQVAKLEKTTKSIKKTQYVRIHTMAKSAPILLATKRRATLLQSQLNSSSNTLSNTLHYEFENIKKNMVSGEINIYKIEYKSSGYDKKYI